MSRQSFLSKIKSNIREIDFRFTQAESSINTRLHCCLLLHEVEKMKKKKKKKERKKKKEIKKIKKKKKKK